MGGAPWIRHAVRVLLLDEQERVLLLRGVRPETGTAFWFPAGGRLEDGEDARSAAVREVAEETGLADVPLVPRSGAGATSSPGAAKSGISASDGSSRGLRTSSPTCSE